MAPEIIGVTVTYREPVTFHLRMIGIDEENKLRQKMFGLTEEEKAEKAYQNNVNLLAELSAKQPEIEGIFPDVTPSENVRAFFSERTVTKERLAEYAVRGYFVRLQPDISFL